MRSVRQLMLAALLSIAAGPSPYAYAADAVDVALVLVTDVSRSIDDQEFQLEKDGYAAAFANPTVLTAIRGGVNGAIAVAYVEFAGSSEVRTVMEWTTIHDEASAQDFATRLKAAPRSFWGRTAISAGIDHAVQLISNGGYVSARHVIDVCGDGTNNAGRDITHARDDAIKMGIIINGLAIINDHPVSWTYAHVQPPGGLTKYYRDNVVGGPGSLVQEIHDFHTFGEAITRKLITEISMRRGVPPGAAQFSALEHTVQTN